MKRTQHHCSCLPVIQLHFVHHEVYVILRHEDPACGFQHAYWYTRYYFVSILQVSSVKQRLTLPLRSLWRPSTDEKKKNTRGKSRDRATLTMCCEREKRPRPMICVTHHLCFFSCAVCESFSFLFVHCINLKGLSMSISQLLSRDRVK